jgi:antitoxin component YwqK of YwqJK toxin-antitoxin module
MTSETDVPNQGEGWLTVYYVYTLIVATACLMEAIGLRSSDVFTVYLLKFGVYAFAAISLKQIGASWVAKFHIGLNAVVVIAGVLTMFAYGIPYSFVALIPWPMLTYFDHPWTYPLLPLAWTIYWVVSKRVKAAYPATGKSDGGPLRVRTKDLTPALNLWSTRAWVNAMIIAAMSTLSPWYFYSYRVLIMSFANEQGDRWPLIYFAYPLVLVAVWVFAYAQITLKKLRRARIIAVIPFALYIISGAADLSDKAAGMHYQRASTIQSMNSERLVESGMQEYWAQRRAERPEGPFTTLHDNGQVKEEGTYNDNGGYDGLVTAWYSSGQKQSEKIYGDATRISLITWHVNGQKWKEYTSEFQREWLEDGQPLTDITFEYSTEYNTGFVGSVSSDGDRTKKDYLDGSEIGYTAWFANGQMKHEMSGQVLRQGSGGFPGSYESEKSWYENGQKQRETYKTGQFGIEHEVTWYENGQKQEERREDMRLAWTEDGQLTKEITLGDDGRPHSGFESYTGSDGIRSESHYLDGSRIKATSWYANGQMLIETTRHDLGRRVYKSEKSWYENGQKKIETCREFSNGNEYKLTWDESGNLTSPPYNGALECP